MKMNNTKEKIIVQKILQFILISVVVGFLGGYTTTVFSKSEAQSWGNAYPNNNLLGLKMNLGLVCISNKNKQPKKINIDKKKGRAPVVGMGAVIHPLKTHQEKKVGIHVIPYVRAKSRSDEKIRPLYLIPNLFGVFNEFYITCSKNYNTQLASKYLKSYPLVLLHVDDDVEKRARLMKYLKGKRWNNFSRPVSTKGVNTIGDLLNKVFSQKQASFLKGFPFNVCVELIDEKNGNVKFLVENVKGGSSPCKLALPKQPQNSTTEKPSTNSSANSESTSEQGYQLDAECEETRQKMACENENAQLKERISQLEEEKSRLEVKRDYLGVKRDEANSAVDKLIAENRRLQSQLKQNNKHLKFEGDQAALLEGTLARLKTQNQELKKIIKLTHTIQRRGEKTSPWLTWLETENNRLTNQVEQLTKQLAITKKLVETNPEIFQLDAEILQLEMENEGLHRRVEKLNKQLANLKQRAKGCSVDQP